jgi:uncharacterized protein DUF1524
LSLAAVALVLTAASGCTVTTTDKNGTTTTTTIGPDSGSGGSGTTSAEDLKTATAQLKKLKVATAASMKGYSRAKFPHWRSTGDNCDVRDSVLKRDGTKVKVSGCNVVAGTWRSAYDGVVLNSPTKVDIDHMVPLANAWRSGAGAWTNDKRGDFANDLADPQLIAVSASSNRAKGDQDPSTWKPKVTGSWCEYAEDWIAVKTVWKLTVTTAEKAALTDMLEKC